MVIHWKTVRTANRMLSNCVMPSLGPIQVSLQSYLSGHFLTPQANANSDESTVSLSTKKEHNIQCVQYYHFHLMFGFPPYLNLLSLITLVMHVAVQLNKHLIAFYAFHVIEIHFKAPFHSSMCFAYCYFTVQNDVCAEFDTGRLKRERFSVLTLN